MEEVVNEAEEIDLIRINGRIAVRNLSLNYFRKKLIRHFNIAFHKQEVEWPRRLKKTTDDK